MTPRSATSFMAYAGGACVRLFLAAIAALALSFGAAAQQSDPLTLDTPAGGLDAAASQTVLAEHFAGVWQVVHTNGDGTAWRGRAVVSGNGQSISLTLVSPDGPQYYEAVEVDAMRFQPGTGPFAAALTARFQQVAEPVHNQAGEIVGAAAPFPLPPTQCLLSFEKEEFNLDLFVIWSNSDKPHLRVQLASTEGEDRYAGVWNEETGDKLIDGGMATWIRGEPRIDKIVVVEDQFDLSAGMVYPFGPDGAEIAQASTSRTLVVYGQNLPEMADQADLQSLSDNLAYIPDFRSGNDRRRVIAEALQRVGGPDPDEVDALIVRADLNAGVGPGAKTLSINGATGTWPLAFANQLARLQFVRVAGVPNDAFYEGDTGFVEVVYEADMPVDDIPLRITLGDTNPIEAGVLLARRVDDDDPLSVTYRTEPIHFYSSDDPSMTPPPDENALRVAVLEGAIVRASPLDTAQALTVPAVAEAEIFSHPSQLGSLWTQALNRVAACQGVAIDDYETYQHEESERISNTIVTELDRRHISFLNGDHAAAILIRDEFIKHTLELLPDFERQARDVTLARQAREAARQSPRIQARPFWRDSEATWVVERPILWDLEYDYSLAETLDVGAIAEEREADPLAVRAWAEQQTMAAAIAYVEQMELAASFAIDIDDCDVEDLLQIAGHRAPPLIDRITPRLVKLDRRDGPPASQSWVPDRVAQDFVSSIHVAGAAIRAQESYAEADTAVDLAVVAIITAGASIGLEAAGWVGASLYLSLSETAVGMIAGLIGVHEYVAAEDYYEFAQGAAPAMGEDILDEALAGRRSAVMAAVGVLLPVAAGASQLNQLRHFKAIQRGQRLMQATDGVLDDVSALSEAQRTDLTAYYLDMLRKIDRSRTGGLSAADEAAFARFQRYFEANGLDAPQTGAGAGQSAEAAPSEPARPDVREMAPETQAPTTPDVREMAPETQVPAAPVEPTAPVEPVAPDPDATVAVRPTADPNEMATEIGPNPWQDRPELYCPAEPPGPRPGDAPNLYEYDPGGWLAERGVTEADVMELIERSRRGETLTPEEILDKIDYMRQQRQTTSADANAAE